MHVPVAIDVRDLLIPMYKNKYTLCDLQLVSVSRLPVHANNSKIRSCLTRCLITALSRDYQHII